MSKSILGKILEKKRIFFGGDESSIILQGESTGICGWELFLQSQDSST